MQGGADYGVVEEGHSILGWLGVGCVGYVIEVDAAIV